jgi:hypothetical protein
VAPDSRIVYVDNDPLVLAHARALLTSTPEGACQYIDADLHKPDMILQAAVRTLDFGQPVALMLNGILGHITDNAEAYAIVNRLMDALPSGSYSISRSTTVPTLCAGKSSMRPCKSGIRLARPRNCLRSIEEIAHFFDGLELVEPGVVSCPRWRPGTNPFGVPAEVDAFGGVGRKP